MIAIPQAEPPDRPPADIMHRLSTARVLMCECGGQDGDSPDACPTCRMYAYALGQIDLEVDGGDYA